MTFHNTHIIYITHSSPPNFEPVELSEDYSEKI